MATTAEQQLGWTLTLVQEDGYRNDALSAEQLDQIETIVREPMDREDGEVA